MSGLNVKILLTGLSAERLWDLDAPPPPQLQIALNVNVLDLKKISDTRAEAPFVMTVQYTPSVGQLTAKGRANIEGTREEITQLSSEVQRNQLPGIVIQAVSSFVMGELVILSKSLGLPPPLPPIIPPSQTQSNPGERFTV